MVKLWISDKLELRWNEWPEKPGLYFTHYTVNGKTAETGQRAAEIYTEALAKAKKESISILGVYPESLTSFQWKPDTFVDYAGEVDVVSQYRLWNGQWRDITDGTTLDEGSQTRKVARLKKAENAAHGYSEGSEIAEEAKLLASFTEGPEISERPRDYFQTLPGCNWEEDYEHENGNYINTCRECGMPFKGHKRRMICKICMAPDWDKLAAKQCPPNNSHAHAGCWLEGEMVGYSRCMVKKVKPLNDQLDAANKRIAELEEENKRLWNMLHDATN